MSGVTGIELGPNYCVLVRGGRLGSHRTVSAAAAMAPTAWPDDPHALVEQLRVVRTREDLPSRARVVSWVMATRQAWRRVRGRGDGRGDARPTCRRRLRDRLGALSRASAGASGSGTSGRRAAGTAVAALSLNSHGAAIAIVVGHRGHPLASRRSGRSGHRSHSGEPVPSCSIATSSSHRLRRSSNTTSISSGRSTA